MRRSKLFLLTFSFTLRDLGNCDDQSGGGREGSVQPPGRTADFSDSKFSQPQTFKHILSDTSSEIGEIGDIERLRETGKIGETGEIKEIEEIEEM